MSAGRALVTGGAGFIGSHLVERLLQAEWSVNVLDDFSSGSRANLPTDDRVTIVSGDIRDRAAVNRALKGCQTVFHLAAVVGVRRINDDPLHAMRVNVDGTMAVLEACHAAGTNVVIASSSEIYGRNPALPYTEDSDRVVGPTNVHRWSYSTAKALDEHLLFAFRTKGLRGAVVRYFNTYGPRQDANSYAGVVATFTDAAVGGRPLVIHGDGRQTRSFCYVTDTANATFLAGTIAEAEGEVFNVGAADELPIARLAELVAEAAGTPLELQRVPFEVVFGTRFEDPARRVPSIEKARRILGYEPIVPLELGLSRTLAWARQRHGSSNLTGK